MMDALLEILLGPLPGGVLGAIGALAIFALVNIAIRQWSISGLPRAYSIAVIGYPKSGKTFLITAVFGELFSGRLFDIKTVPRGQETIERINRDLEALAIGRSLGPTTDQDLFAYRADITRGHSLFVRKYKVEIGDFPEPLLRLVSAF